MPTKKMGGEGDMGELVTREGGGGGSQDLENYLDLTTIPSVNLVGFSANCRQSELKYQGRGQEGDATSLYNFSRSLQTWNRFC